MKIVWCTDIHLNFASKEPATFAKISVYDRFVGDMAKAEADVAFITGDIAEADNVWDYLLDLDKKLGIPIYFVLDPFVPENLGTNSYDVLQRLLPFEFFDDGLVVRGFLGSPIRAHLRFAEWVVNGVASHGSTHSNLRVESFIVGRTDLAVEVDPQRDIV